MNDYMISMDFGRSFAFAFWKNKKVSATRTIKVGDDVIVSLLEIHNAVEYFIKHYSPTVVLEKPGRDWAYQWVQYKDVQHLVNVNKCDFAEYMTKTVKKIVSGSGNADKEDMLNAVWGMLEEYADGTESYPDNEHEVDAIAVGICHLKKVGGGQVGELEQ